MKKFLIIIVSIVLAFIAFAIIAGIIAAIFTSLANSNLNFSSSITIFLGISSEIIKFVGAIFVGVKTFKILKKNYNIL
jgi:hypothetical protein